MNTKFTFILTALLVIPTAFSQVVYKCPDSSGKIVYQQSPCSNGEAIMQLKPKPIFTPRLTKEHNAIKKSINEQKQQCLLISNNLSKNSCLKEIDEKIKAECQFCFKDDKQTLTIRAEDWMNLLSNLEKMSEKQAVIAMEEYLEPSAATKKRALEYYEMYNNRKDYINRSGSLENVRIDDSEELGEVRYTSVQGKTEKELKTYTEIANWIKRNGTWYRTIEKSSGHYNE